MQFQSYSFQFQNKQYLIVVDFYLKYFEVELLRRSPTSCVINNLKKFFARFGIPEEVNSDNGSQCANTRNVFSRSHEFKKFAKEWEFRLVSNIPEYPQSNGAVERAVQTAKRIFRKSNMDNKDPFERLLKYCNTPLEYIGASPTQLLMGRRTRTTISIHRRLLTPRTFESTVVVKKLQHRQLVSKKFYDRHNGHLSPLEAADKVRIRPNGIIRGVQLRFCRDLPVNLTGNGPIYRRKRKQIISVANDGAHNSEP